MESYIMYFVMGLGGLFALATLMRHSDNSKTLSLKAPGAELTTLNDKQLESEIKKLMPNKMAALKLLRQQRGLGLKEAKDALDSFETSGMLKLPTASFQNPMLDARGYEESIKSLIRRGKKIEAIKLMREQTQLGLKEAKEEVEKIERSLK